MENFEMLRLNVVLDIFDFDNDCCHFYLGFVDISEPLKC